MLRPVKGLGDGQSRITSKTPVMSAQGEVFLVLEVEIGEVVASGDVRKLVQFVLDGEPGVFIDHDIFELFKSRQQFRRIDPNDAVWPTTVPRPGGNRLKSRPSDAERNAKWRAWYKLRKQRQRGLE